MPTYRKYFTESTTERRDPDAPSKSDVNKLLSFSEHPEKYATGTSRMMEKVQYLDSVMHKFSEGQQTAYDAAKEKYDAVLVAKAEIKAQPKKEYAAIIKEAFDNRRSVKIRYKGSWRTIDPYVLNDTYVVSYCHFARDIRTFRVDRVQGAELSEPFSFDKSIQTTAQSRLVEAPSYSYRGYRRR
ncbi:MAG: WYL domain-containing protein [Candidatus Kaiserbacteria bacterium]|nr:WYL domain-containing protein [Candidatus Kaiserbacteria bacterium]